MMETSDEALVREMSEELAIRVEITNLVWIVENFYEESDEQNHEIGMYYTAKLPDDSPLIDKDTFSCEDNGVEILFKWFDSAETESINLYPSFLKKGLKDLPTCPTRIVHRD